jgi:hypothetical protein
LEARARKVQLVDKRVDDSHRVVVTYEVIQAFRQESHLRAVLAFDVSRHTGS